MDQHTFAAFRDQLPSLMESSRERDHVFHWRPQITFAAADKR
jgi:hypothetical protein